MKPTTVDAGSQAERANDNTVQIAPALLAHESQQSSETQQSSTHVPAETARPVMLHGSSASYPLAQWNAATERAFPDTLCVQELFEAQVAKTPDAEAIVFENTVLTYQQFNARANQFAHWLHQHDVGAGDIVGLYVERSAEMVVALWGILKSGAAYVPIDPQYPQNRVSAIIQSSGARYIITQQSLVDELPDMSANSICIDDENFAAELGLLSSENPTIIGSAEDLAYIIYTSGSTGHPKGVQIRHRSLVNVVLAMSRRPGMTAADTILAHATLSFDVSLMEICLPFIVGARAVIVPSNTIIDAQTLTAQIERYAITIIQATPTHWNLLLSQGWSGKTTLIAWTGGEPLTQTLARSLFTHVGAIWNLYGPTETTVWSAIEQITDPEATITIGRPIDNTRLYILDDQQRMVPIGEEGELYIAGSGLARGYQGSPEMTAENFVHDPFQDDVTARMYRTGDRARYLADGRVACLGRNNTQVKLRGYRIELGEIEMTLARHPDIALTAVVVWNDPSGIDHLAAYYQPQPQTTVDLLSLQALAHAELPLYMVPTLWTEVADLPRTISGKIDRRALPPPVVQPVAEMPAEMLSQMNLEQRLLLIWRDLLHQTEISPTDNFFQCGGHSLLAVMLVERIRNEWGQTLSLATIFRHPTVAELAHVIADATNERQSTLITALNAQGTKRPLFYLPGGWAASAFYCYALARELGKDQPFNIVDSVLFDDSTDLPSIEAIAEQYVHEIRAIQPNGPYQIAGFCNGALFAMEIARILRAEGEDVDSLILIEPLQPTRLAQAMRLGERVGQRLHINRAAQLDLYLRARHLWKFAQPSLQKRTLDREYLRARDVQLDQPFPPRSTLRKDYIGVLSWLSDRFEQSRYAGQVNIIWDSDETFFRENWHRAAERLGTTVDVTFVKGTYLTSRVEHIHDFARHLCHILHQAETRRQPRRSVEA